MSVISMKQLLEAGVWIGHVTNVARVITKITATLIPTAVSSFLDTPRNGQIPKNLDNTKLFVRIAAKKIETKPVTDIIHILLSQPVRSLMLPDNQHSQVLPALCPSSLQSCLHKPSKYRIQRNHLEQGLKLTLDR